MNDSTGQITLALTLWDGSALPPDLKRELEREAQRLVMEFFGCRGFRNRREMAAAAGLVGTSYNSGEVARDQGI